jgi:FMN reductase [NAD(P)H]
LPENKQYIIENSKQNLAQVYTDVRYTGKDNEAMSEGMLKALKHQGFLK